MTITFNPAHKYFVWFDYSGKNGHIVLADQVEVLDGGALKFSSQGNDGRLYVTTVVSPTSYAHFEWYGDASIALNGLQSDHGPHAAGP